MHPWDVCVSPGYLYVPGISVCPWDICVSPACLCIPGMSVCPWDVCVSPGCLSMPRRGPGHSSALPKSSCLAHEPGTAGQGCSSMTSFTAMTSEHTVVTPPGDAVTSPTRCAAEPRPQWAVWGQIPIKRVRGGGNVRPRCRVSAGARSRPDRSPARCRRQVRPRRGGGSGPACPVPSRQPGRTELNRVPVPSARSAPRSDPGVGVGGCPRPVPRSVVALITTQ